MLDLWQAHLTFGLLAFVLLPGFGLSSGPQLLRLILLLAISFISIDGLSLAAYMRSFTDELAITSLVALVFAAMVRIGLATPLSQAARLQLVLLVAGASLFLYPATMGLSFVDPYRLGYNPRPLLVVIGVLAIGLLMLRNWLAVCMLGLATLAFSLQLKASPNYWDYLLDPFIALYCCGAVVVLVARRLLRGALERRQSKLPISL